jgi:hypothetical protein
MVCGVALQDSITALVPVRPEERGDLTARYVTELLRVARAGLFIDPTAARQGAGLGPIEQTTHQAPPKGD